MGPQFSPHASALQPKLKIRPPTHNVPRITTPKDSYTIRTRSHLIPLGYRQNVLIIDTHRHISIGSKQDIFSFFLVLLLKKWVTNCLGDTLIYHLERILVERFVVYACTRWGEGKTNLELDFHSLNCYLTLPIVS